MIVALWVYWKSRRSSKIKYAQDEYYGGKDQQQPPGSNKTSSSNFSLNQDESDPDKNELSRGGKYTNNTLHHMAGPSLQANYQQDLQEAYTQKEKLLRKMSEDQTKDAINILSNM